MATTQTTSQQLPASSHTPEQIAAMSAKIASFQIFDDFCRGNDFFSRIEARAVPFIGHQTGQWIATVDAAEVIAIAEQINRESDAELVEAGDAPLTDNRLYLEFSAPDWRDTLTDMIEPGCGQTRTTIRLVEHASDMHFHYDEDAGTWCLAAREFGPDTDDQPARSEDDAAQQALQYLIESGST